MEISLQADVLRWARERSGLSIASLAEKVKAKPERIRAWERTGRLTLTQAERLAHAARIPLGYLYFPEPPAEDLPIQDFRTVEGAPVSAPSPELLDVIYDAQRKQDWYREYLIAEGGDPMPWVGSLSASVEVKRAAAMIRDRMGVQSGRHVGGAAVAEALARHVAVVESQGVLVMRSGIVGNNTHRGLDVKEFRGFALADPYAPLIFVNAKDAQTAQTFTLMHELVHLWLGMSGVSNPLQRGVPADEAERFCNAVAAELLVPREELVAEWMIAAASDDPIDRLCRVFKVSSLVVLRRVRDLGLVNESTFKRLYREAEERFLAAPARPKSEGGNFYATQFTRNSRPFVRALATSTFEGRTPYREALGLLGVSTVKTFRELANRALSQT